MIGRYPQRSAFAFRSRSRWSTTLVPSMGVETAPFAAWWFGPDGITASNVFDKGFVTLKRWTGTQWVSAVPKIYKLYLSD